jgi:D-alanine-D-alanine ligase
MTEKTRVAVLYGGKSGEHEVSLKSAASVLRHLDGSRFEPVPISIDKQGRWQRQDARRLAESNGESLPIFVDAPEIRLTSSPSGTLLAMPVDGAAKQEVIDVVFPVIHGPLCEDGAVQGLLDLAGAAYVGSGVMASAVGMHKDMAKRLVSLAGLPVAPYIVATKRDYARDPAAVAAAARAKLALPVFVKPCNMGSSVGVHKVKRWEDFGAALNDAFAYDIRVLIEQGIDAREIEVAVLDGDPPFASVASELNAGPQHEFYSYDAKYVDADGATVDLPAKLTPEQMGRVQELAKAAFTALECSGLARVDFFLDRASDQFYFNEINTLPGFTAISMYPKMMEASGMAYPTLITKLIELALERHSERAGLKTDYAG